MTEGRTDARAQKICDEIEDVGIAPRNKGLVNFIESAPRRRENHSHQPSAKSAPRWPRSDARMREEQTEASVFDKVCPFVGERHRLDRHVHAAERGQGPNQRHVKHRWCPRQDAFLARHSK